MELRRAIQDFQRLGFGLFGALGAGISGVKFTQLDQKAHVRITPPGSFLQDFQSLFDLIALQIKLRQIAIAEQRIRHFADGGAVGLDGQLLFAKDTIDAA